MSKVRNERVGAVQRSCECEVGSILDCHSSELGVSLVVAGAIFGEFGLMSSGGKSRTKCFKFDFWRRSRTKCVCYDHFWKKSHRTCVFFNPEIAGALDVAIVAQNASRKRDG